MYHFRYFFSVDGQAEYFAFVQRLQWERRPDGAATQWQYARCRWVRPLAAALMLHALLAGCAAGALTCNQVTLRQGASCELRPAFPTFLRPLQLKGTR